MDWTNKYVLSILTAGLMALLAKLVKNHLNREVQGTKPLYRLDHSVLSIPLPPQSMWMNNGFWKDTEDFPTACRALLEEVLRSAQIFQDEVSSNKNANTLSIIDLGYGCGDQCLYIKGVLDSQRVRKQNQWRGLLRAYVGITLERSHFDITQERLSLAHSDTSDGFEIHCADAGRPASWAPEIRNSISSACQTNGAKGDHENWILALDTLVHFQPSRWPIIKYANRQLDASLMAYDLCIAENLSVVQRILLRLIAFFGHSPFANLVTIREYRERLVEAGYTPERIEIRDISEHVFIPLARFSRRKEVELKQYGLSIGRYRYTAGMFGWWGRTGVVRGCIIVARK